MSILDEGATLIHDVMTVGEEAKLVWLIDQAPWSNALRRRVQHYGYEYSYQGGEVRATDTVPPLPPWAIILGGRLGPWFKDKKVEQCIVNEYWPGQWIGMHTDHRNFGPVVASVSLADEWPMQFRRRSVRPYVRGARPGDEIIMLPRRSAIVLTGPARYAWMHGIDPVASRGRQRRLSATFRTLA